VTGLRLPECVRVHNHPVVIAFAEQAEIIFADRDRLQTARHDRHGKIIRPALPQLLMHQAPGEGKEAFKRRRADFMQGLLAATATELAYLDYDELLLREPGHAEAKADPHLSLRRLAEKAELVSPDYVTRRGKGGWRKRRDPGDRCERIVRFQKRIGLVTFTKQQRIAKHAGSKAGMRRFSLSALMLWGPVLARELKKAHRKALDERNRLRRDAAKANAEFEEAVTEGRQPLIAPGPAPAPAPGWEGRLRGQPSTQIADMVEQEHKGDPAWGYAEILAEARRIEARLASDDVVRPSADVDSS